MLQLENVLEIVEMENIYLQHQLDLQLPQMQVPQQTQLTLQEESYNLVWIVQMVVLHVPVQKIVKLVKQDLI